MLNINGLGKHFLRHDGREVKALEGISLDIGEGEFVALVGPSGCGKSTLLRLIAGLELPSQGTITLDGLAITGPGSQVGMVFQHYASFPWLSVRENIGFGLRLAGLPEDIVRARVDTYLSLTGLRAFSDSYPAQLSGGMRQRVAIARTLASDPKVILLDEPFGALDVQTRAQMQEFLAKLAEESGKTMILVTHDIPEALYLADRVFVLGLAPGEVREVLDVPIPRPRHPEVRFDPLFLGLEKHCTYVIRSEIIKAAMARGERVQGAALRIGMNTWSGIAPLFVAQEQGLFAKAGFSADLISVEKEAVRLEAFQRGDIQVLNLTLDSAALLSEQVADLRVVASLSRSVGGDAIICKKGIGTIPELKARRIALETRWVSHYFLLYVLGRHGLSSADVEIVDMKGSEIGGALLAGKVDAAVLWDPWLSALRHLPDFHTLASTREFPVIYDVLVARQSDIEERPEHFAALQHIWGQAVGMMGDDPEESVRIASGFVGISERELLANLKEVIFLTDFDRGDLAAELARCESVLLAEQMLAAPTAGLL